MSSRALLVPLLVLSVPLVSACSVGHGRSDSRDSAGQLITSETIRSSGLSNGWDVLRRYADHLTFSEHETGPVRVNRRGRESVYLTESPMLIIDGVKVRSFRVLINVPARDIESMLILSAMEGNVRYGINGGDGVIIVQTIRTYPEDGRASSPEKIEPAGIAPDRLGYRTCC